MRFYSFVANLYLSPLQHGLQTAHAVSEMFVKYDGNELFTEEMHAFDDWARDHKTIIICAAVNSEGVLNAAAEANFFGAEFCLPSVIFHEDAQSLNGAPTAAGIVVPARFYEAVPAKRKRVNFLLRALGKKSTGPAFTYTDPDGKIVEYAENSVATEFIKWLKSYRLA